MPDGFFVATENREQATDDWFCNLVCFKSSCFCPAFLCLTRARAEEYSFI